MIPIAITLSLLGALGFAFLLVEARRRGLGFRVLVNLVRGGMTDVGRGDVHLLLCVADHFEPYWNDAGRDVADGRVGRWVRDYPERFEGFRDSDGRPPRHTFFYPIDQYDPEHVDALAGLCRAGFGEIEVHLHHRDDTAENLRETLLSHKNLMAQRHGVGVRDSASGGLTYAFIHGDWALDNSRPDGRCCGVDNELDVLRETGCYADLTMPSYPSPTQTRKINSLYYAVDDPTRPKSHDWGTDVGLAEAPARSLLMIQGPLALNWRQRAKGLFPRVENGCIQANQAPSLARLSAWLNARVQVPSRPDWYFVKLHTHGAPEANQEVLLGEPMVAFHEALARKAEADPSFHFHYLTAREMTNLVKAAEAGWRGSVDEARDFRFVPEAAEVALPEGHPGVGGKSRSRNAYRLDA